MLLPQPRKGFKLSSIVTALVLASAIASLLICSYVGYRSEKESLTATNLELNQLYSDKIAATANSLFEVMSDSLKAGASYFAEDLRGQDLHGQLVFFQQNHPMFNSVFLIDENGKLIEGSNAEPGSLGTPIDSAGVRQALQERRSIVSEPYIGVTNKLVIMVSEPMTDASGRYIGFIGGSIRLHEHNIFQTVMSGKPGKEEDTSAFVVSSSGMLLYDEDTKRIGEDASENKAVIQLLQGKSGTMAGVKVDGKEMLASFSYIKETGWGIVVQTPADNVRQSARDLVRKLVLYTLPLLIAVMLLISRLIGFLSSPLSKMARFASRLSPSASGGEEIPSIHKWNYEANELHKAFGRAIRHFRYQFEFLSLEAQTDALTGLFNRRTMDRLVQVWIAQDVPFAMVILDLDNFKQVNDTYGHEMGDEVLKFLAGNLRKLVKDGNPICRFGGEEFVVLLTNEHAEAAPDMAERIRAHMATHDSPTGRPITLSIGVAGYPDTARSAELLFRQADDALYRAKRNGKNRVELATASELEASLS